MISICIPTYNGEKTIKIALDSILSQNYADFEIIISDDCSKDNTVKIIKSYKDQRIRLFQNPKNLGYGDNLNTFRSHLKGDILMLFAQDDILLKDALTKIVNAFTKDEDVGIVTRPYYQFEFDPKIPVRFWPPPDETHDTVITLNSPKKLIEAAVTSTYLVSCLAFRVKYLDLPFNSHVFTSQAYPFFSIFKKHKIVYLKDYIVAVGIYESQCRHKPSIYIPSPVATWIKVFEVTLAGKKYDRVRKICQDFVAQNYIGLVQIKNYGNYKILLTEIKNHIKFRKISLLDWRFWFYSGISLFVPRFLLIKIVDRFKSKVLSQFAASRVKIQI